MSVATATEKIFEVDITREAIIADAEKSLEGVEDEALREAVMEVARTADRICLDWEAVDHSCYCLVGTARVRHGLEPNPTEEGGLADYRSEDRVGMKFYDLHARDGEWSAAGSVVYVIREG